MSPSPDDEPLLRLEKYLAADRTRLDEARERLVDIGDALMTLRARMYDIDLGDDPGVQVLDQEVAAPIIDTLAGTVDRTDEVIMALDAGAGQREDNARNERVRAAAGQRQRVILHPAALESEFARRELAAMRVTGQQHRISEAVGTEFLVLGHDAVITLTTWGDPHSPYVIIRNPALVRSFAAWFELLWSTSPQVEASEFHAEKALVRMLALGVKDEVIARSLHIGLRTVRRRVAALMERYGVATRFQLGAALERDGVLPRPPR